MSEERAMMPIADTRREVSAQPETVARVLDEQREGVRHLAEELAGRNTNQILASGSGDSWFASQAVRLAFERYAGLPMEPLQAYEYAAYGRLGEDEQTAHIVISSSGRRTTTWDALDRALASGSYVVGITDKNDPANPFVSRPHTALIPGASKVGWPAQTTTATIAILLDLAICLGKLRGHLDSREGERLANILRSIPDQMEEALSAGQQWASTVVPTLKEKRLYTFVGGGPNYAVAQNGSALLAEGPQEVGLALPVEEFHHGLRIGTLGLGDPVVLVAPNGATASRSRDTARSVRAWGARLLPLVSAGTRDIQVDDGDGVTLSEVEEPFSPLLTLLPLHMLSIELSAQKVAGGYSRPEAVP